MVTLMRAIGGYSSQKTLNNTEPNLAFEINFPESWLQHRRPPVDMVSSHLVFEPKESLTSSQDIKVGSLAHHIPKLDFRFRRWASCLLFLLYSSQRLKYLLQGI